MLRRRPSPSGTPAIVCSLPDVLELHYRYSPEFDQTVTVQPDGFVALQLVGDLKRRILTVNQAKGAILEMAGQRLKDPEITLVLKDFEKPYFTVGGEVTSSGRFEMRGSITALQAIMMAGGFKTASAKHSQVGPFRKIGRISQRLRSWISRLPWPARTQSRTSTFNPVTC